LTFAREGELTTRQQQAVRGGEAQAIIDLFDELAGKILGIDLSMTSDQSSLEGDLMKLIVRLRENLRKEKLWKLSDTIRDSLGDLGITIEDKPEGTSWRRSSSHLKSE
jgi:cysteinyl-tRNA synthetase